MSALYSRSCYVCTLRSKSNEGARRNSRNSVSPRPTGPHVSSSTTTTPPVLMSPMLLRIRRAAERVRREERRQVGPRVC